MWAVQTHGHPEFRADHVGLYVGYTGGRHGHLFRVFFFFFFSWNFLKAPDPGSASPYAYRTAPIWALGCDRPKITEAVTVLGVPANIRRPLSEKGR